MWRALSLEELRLILAISRNEPNLRDLHDVLMIVSNTGIRSRQLGELRWADIDTQRRRFVVGRNSPRAYEHYVRFGARTHQMLEARREREPDTEYVFGTSPRAFLARCSRQLRTVSETVGIEHISLSVLRSTFFLRWVLSRKSLDALLMISGERLGRVKVQVNWKHELAVGIRNQARLEEELER